MVPVTADVAPPSDISNDAALKGGREREVTVASYTWELPGPLGLKMMIRGRDANDPKGVQVSGFAEAFPSYQDPAFSGIEHGMPVLAVNGQDVERGSYNTVVERIEAATRSILTAF